jgi:hypothetical protein
MLQNKHYKHTDNYLWRINPQLAVISRLTCYDCLHGLVVCGGGDMDGIGGIWNPGMVGNVVGTVSGMDGIVVGTEGIDGMVPGKVGMVGMVAGTAGTGRDGTAPGAIGAMVTLGMGMDGTGGIANFGTAGMEGIGGSVVGTAGMEGIGGSVVGTAGTEDAGGSAVGTFGTEG